MIEFDVERLHLNDGDIVVLKMRHSVGPEMAQRMREDLKRILGEDRKVLVLTDGVDLQIIASTKDVA